MLRAAAGPRQGGAAGAAAGKHRRSQRKRQSFSAARRPRRRPTPVSGEDELASHKYCSRTHAHTRPAQRHMGAKLSGSCARQKRSHIDHSLTGPVCVRVLCVPRPAPVVGVGVILNHTSRYAVANPLPFPCCALTEGDSAAKTQERKKWAVCRQLCRRTGQGVRSDYDWRPVVDH